MVIFGGRQFQVEETEVQRPCGRNKPEGFEEQKRGPCETWVSRGCFGSLGLYP